MKYSELVSSVFVKAFFQQVPGPLVLILRGIHFAGVR